MKILKKALLIALTAVTSLGLLVSCAKEAEKPTPQPQAPPYVEGPAPESTDFVPTFRFVVASDMHISANNPDSQMTKVRFRDMFTQMNAYADAQEYDRVDAVLLAGDITDGGTNADLAAAKQIVDANLAEESELVITMGNHDFWGNKNDPAAMIAQFEHKFGDSNSHKEIGGYHFITLCADKSRAGDPGWDYSESVVEYARTELAKAYEDTGDDKPIFVMQHVGNTNTCAGTCEHTNGNAVRTLNDLFAQYPNIVCFAGHSHFACNDECSIHQKDYTSIATGGMYYSTKTTLNGLGIAMENQYEMAQNYVVEMGANNVMRVRCWDILQEKFVGETWTVESWDKEDFLYTEDRFAEGDLFFAESATVSTTSVGAYEATVSFDPVPQESLTARIYKVVVTDGAGKEACVRYVSNDYFNEPTEPIEVEVSGLVPQTQYTVSVTALNSLFCSELNRADTTVKGRLPVMKSQPISVALTTAAKPPKPVDEVLSFTEQADVAAIMATGATLSWVEAANGVTGGVLKVAHSGSATPKLTMDMTSLCTAYKEYDWLVVRAYFSNKLSGSMADMNVCGKDDDYFKSWIYHNAWKNYVYKISSLTEAQAAALELQLTTTNNSTAAGEFWIDEIYLMKDASKADLSVKTSGTLVEYQTVSVSLENPSNAAVKAFTLKAPDGETVETPQSFTAKMGVYTATVTLVSGNQSDSTRNALYYGGKNTDLVFTFTVAEAPKTLTVKFGEHTVEDVGGDKIVTIPSYVVKKDDAPITPTAVDISVEVKNAKLNPIEIVDGQFTAPLEGATYEITYAVDFDGKTERFVYSFAIDRPTAAQAHSIVDFDYVSDVDNFYVDGKSNITWLESYGKTKVGDGTNDILVNGVVKVDYAGTTAPWFSFKPAHLMANYQGYDYIIFHIMCVGGANQINSLQPAAGSDCEHTGNGDHKSSWTYTDSVYFNAYAFKISAFLNAWTDSDVDTAVAKVQLTAAGSGAGTYYIAGIYAAKSIENAVLDIKLNGTLRVEATVAAGDTVSIETYNPEQYPYIDMTVTGPDGQTVTNLSSFTAAAGTYTVTFKHNTIGGTSGDSNYYHVRHDYGGCYSRGGAVKTVTFTVEQ